MDLIAVHYQLDMVLSADSGGDSFKQHQDAVTFLPPSNVSPFLRKLVVQEDVQTRYKKIFERRDGLHNIKSWLFRTLLWRTYSSASMSDNHTSSINLKEKK
tara:strand:- start:124 stop:426 length:303 start_codon:yes stop_codon:yes gene_type:complete